MNKVDILFLQETIRQDFSLGELDSLEVGDKFLWTWLPANGHSGGLLAGFRDSVFDVGSVSKGEFLLTTQVCLKGTRFLFEFVGVYGPMDHGRSPVFLLELKSSISRSPFLVFMAGEFNLIRGRADKNNNNIDWQRVHQFNDCIARLQLSEVVRSGARYTWSNKQRNPVRCVLDKVLVSPTWETSFPLMSLLAKSSIGSDHSPLVFSTGKEAPPRSNRFFFEKSWLSIPSFSNLICSKWGEFARDQRRCFDLLDLWQVQSGKLRSFLKGWGANLKKEARAEKDSLLSQIKELDLIADGVGLLDEDWGWRYHLEGTLVLLYQREEE
jgi:hypothetical protein